MLGLLALLLIQDSQPVEKRLKELEKKVEDLQKEKENRPLPETRAPEIKFHLFGYGEVHVNDPMTGTMIQDARTVAELHRIVLGFGVDLGEMWSLEAEFDFEHAFRTPEVEFVHLDGKLNQALNLRAGVLLMPVGSLNEVHEPPRFFSVERPYVHNLVIPTTWQEPGIGIYGTLPFEEINVRYRLYFVQGLDPQAFRNSDGIRPGRGRGVDNLSFADGWAFTERVEVQPLPWLTVGTSGYAGRSIRVQAGPSVYTDVFIWTADVHVARDGFDIHAEIAQILIPNADNATRAAAAANRPVAERIDGWFVEIGYDVFHHVLDTDLRLVVFFRHEFIDTQAHVPHGFVEARGNRREINTVGVAFYVLPNLAFKIDHEMWCDDLDQDLFRWNFGIAFEYHP